ncbi:MAG: hypothetical protein FWC68_00540 [Oscillospiraceae bacterium]|nr:hypothetical protein [Oscillospiraceae bacterium]
MKPFYEYDEIIIFMFSETPRRDMVSVRFNNLEEGSSVYVRIDPSTLEVTSTNSKIRVDE